MTKTQALKKSMDRYAKIHQLLVDDFEAARDYYVDESGCSLCQKYKKPIDTIDLSNPYPSCWGKCPLSISLTHNAGEVCVQEWRTFNYYFFNEGCKQASKYAWLLYEKLMELWIESL